MGVLSLILGMLGVCICWLPVAGWLGIVMGAFSCALGVLAITRWFKKTGNTGFGVAGVFLGTIALSLGLAFQVKHAHGDLDMLFFPLNPPMSYLSIAGFAALVAISLMFSRLKARNVGALMSALSLVALVVSASWALTTADREYQRDHVAIQNESAAPQR